MGYRSEAVTVLREVSTLRLGAIALVLIAGLCLGTGCSGGSSSSEQPAVTQVQSVTVKRQPLPRTLRATGTLFGEEETTVSAKVAGRVSEVLHDIGDEVAPGQPLLKIDDTDYSLARAAKLETARESLARVGLTALPPENFDVSRLPSVERARLQAENVKSRFERAQKLHTHEPPLLSDQEFSDIQTQYDVARNDSKLAVLTAKSQIAEARAQYAQLQQAEQLIRDAVHTVPFGSLPSAENVARPRLPQYLVSARHASIGDYVSVGTPLFRLIDPDPLKLRIPIPERHIGRIAIAQKALITTDAFDEAVEGTISRIGPSVNVESRTFEVEILVPNAGRRLRAGMFARADINVGSELGLVVPQSAIRSFAGVNKVVIIEAGKAAEKLVTLGQKEGDGVELTSGVKEGDSIVVKPPISLTTGMPVAIADKVDAAKQE